MRYRLSSEDRRYLVEKSRALDRETSLAGKWRLMQELLARWQEIGQKMGFDPMTVTRVESDAGDSTIDAVPNDNVVPLPAVPGNDTEPPGAA